MDSLSIHRTTDALARARADIKVEYWGKVVEGKLPLPAGKDMKYATERLQYWIQKFAEYEERIKKHIAEFNKIKDPISFLVWIEGVISTIKKVINLITGK